MNKTDGVIRSIIAAVIAILFFTNVISGVFGTILLVVAAIFLITSFMHICPIYSVLGLSTCKTESPKKSSE